MKLKCLFSALIGALILVISPVVNAQLPYTTALYSYDSIIDHSYGSAIDYAGNTVDLTMDIYTPNNDNCHRPIAVLVHGGAWVGGSKEDIDMVRISRFLAERGYVVANINYRLGTHKAANYDMYLLCNTTISAPCAYISDSAEVYRANFRAMQDVKGAIRYMKSRYMADSSDFNNVFLVGQSAGGFISMTAAFLNQASEKPSNCGAIANAPNPDSNLAAYGCVPSPISFARPDLGSVEGDLHLGSFDASVQGVGNIYGGLLEPAIATAADVQNTAIYQFHQGSDVVVHYNQGRILGRTSFECYAQTNLCQNYFFYPNAYGSKGLDAYFLGLAVPLDYYQTEIIENYEYLNDCLDNGHSVDAINLRASNMAAIFAEKLDANGNVPSSVCNVGLAEGTFETTRIYPNPVEDQLNIALQGSGSSAYSIYTLDGQMMSSGELESKEEQISVAGLSAGMYLLIIEGPQTEVFRFVRR